MLGRTTDGFGVHRCCPPTGAETAHGEDLGTEGWSADSGSALPKPLLVSPPSPK
jgi:hypothetical protein